MGQTKKCQHKQNTETTAGGGPDVAKLNTGTWAPSSPLEHSSSYCSGQPGTAARDQDQTVCGLWPKQAECNTNLVVVSSLLDECIYYFLSLLVAFLLQVSDECVQIPRSIICLHNRLVCLNDESNACKYKPLACKTQQRKVHNGSAAVWFCSPSSSSVSVSANTKGALFSPRSPPVASSRFSSAFDASWENMFKETEKYISILRIH